MDPSARRLSLLLVVVGLAAFTIGAAFVGRAFAGEDAVASWLSATVGVVGGGCCVAYGLYRGGR